MQSVFATPKADIAENKQLRLSLFIHILMLLSSVFATPIVEIAESKSLRLSQFISFLAFLFILIKITLNFIFHCKIMNTK